VTTADGDTAIVPSARRVAKQWQIYALTGPNADAKLNHVDAVAEARAVCLVRTTAAYVPNRVSMTVV
jgi:hypothetical protein